jgi:hypothetical protein
MDNLAKNWQLINILFCGYRQLEIHYCWSMKNACRNLYSPGHSAPATNYSKLWAGLPLSEMKDIKILPKELFRKMIWRPIEVFADVIDMEKMEAFSSIFCVLQVEYRGHIF